MDLEYLFPELNEINNEELRSAVILSLAKAITKGGWSITDINKIPFTLLIPELMESDSIPKISLVDHIRAVTKLSLAVYAQYEKFSLESNLNRDEIIAGALLHDVGKFIEYKDKNGKIVQTNQGQVLRHPALGLELVAEFNLPISVRQAIVFHSKEGEKINLLPEVEIISRCDFLFFIPVKKILQH